MVYAYVRVSTEHQTTENQKLEIERFCERNGLQVDEWIDETISGTRQPESRKLGKLMKQLHKDDFLICTELSRLGRSLIMIMNILQTFLEKEVKVWTIKDGYRLGDDIQSKVLAFAFGLSAEIERKLISERTKLGIQRARALGKRIGREKGESPTIFKLSPFDDYIRQQMIFGRSKNSLAKELGVTWGTLDRHLKRIMFN